MMVGHVTGDVKSALIGLSLESFYLLMHDSK